MAKMLSDLTRLLIVATLLFNTSHTYRTGGRIFYKKPAKCNNPNGKLGMCISIDQCETLKIVLRNRIENSYEFIKLSQCQNDAELPWKSPFVCCSRDSHFIEKSNENRRHKITFPTGTPPAVDLNVDVTENDIHQPVMLPKSPVCGAITIVNKIYGGAEAELTEFSWMVNLEYRTGELAKCLRKRFTL